MLSMPDRYDLYHPSMTDRGSLILCRVRMSAKAVDVVSTVSRFGPDSSDRVGPLVHLIGAFERLPMHCSPTCVFGA